MFRYALKDRVRIKELEMMIGTVRQCLLVYTGIQYEVRYFDKGDAKTVWFYEDELEAV